MSASASTNESVAAWEADQRRLGLLRSAAVPATPYVKDGTAAVDAAPYGRGAEPPQLQHHISESQAVGHPAMVSSSAHIAIDVPHSEPVNAPEATAAATGETECVLLKRRGRNKSYFVPGAPQVLPAAEPSATGSPWTASLAPSSPRVDESWSPPPPENSEMAADVAAAEAAAAVKSVPPSSPVVSFAASFSCPAAPVVEANAKKLRVAGSGPQPSQRPTSRPPQPTRKRRQRLRRAPPPPPLPPPLPPPPTVPKCLRIQLLRRLSALSWRWRLGTWCVGRSKTSCTSRTRHHRRPSRRRRHSFSTFVPMPLA